MIDNWFEFELNGVKYKGKSVGGDPPIRESGQALRAQNAQLVQGEDSAVFNMRPDVLVFSWTDWSGGEGQFNFDPEQPARYWSGRSINGFSRPGTLQVGPAVQRTVGNDGSTVVDFTDTNASPTLVLFQDNLYLAADNELYLWDSTNKKWGIPIDTSGSFSEMTDAAANDSIYMYMNEADDEIWRYDGTTLAQFGASQASGTPGFAAVEVMGGYVHMLDFRLLSATSENISIRELLKSASPNVTGSEKYNSAQGHTRTIPTGTPGKRLVTRGPNRIYMATVQGMLTTIHSYTPTTAAATGSGSIVAMIPVQGMSIEWAGGLLYLHASTTGLDGSEQEGAGVLMYVNPEDGTYGIVDRVRPSCFTDSSSTTSGSIQRNGASLLENYWAVLLSETSGADQKIQVMVTDTTTGALHPYAICQAGHADAGPMSIARYRGEVFVAEARAAGAYVHRLRSDRYEGDNVDPEVISPLWDFGLVDDKILSSIRVSCEAVPTDWSLAVDYQLDESGSWVNAGSVAAAADGGTFTVTTDSSTKAFRQLRLRVRFLWAGTGDPTTTPVLLGVEARAQVSQKLRSWTVILDCSDDQGQAQNQSLKGHQKIDNIQTAGTPGGNAVAFKNGFSHRQINQYDEYDVIVDDYEIFFQRPGEAYAVVRLIEVA